MPNTDYIGRYGAILRQLSEMENPQPQGAFSGGGGAGSPSFGGGQPRIEFGRAEGPFSENSGTSGPRDGAFAEPEDAAMPDGEVSLPQLWDKMPNSQKDAIGKQLEDSGLDIESNYKKILASGIIEMPPKNPTRRDKILALADIALRTISNYGRPTTNSAADFADAVLAHNKERDAKTEAGQRTALGLAVQQQGQALRSQERRQDAAARMTEGEARREESDADRESREAEGEANRQNALKLQRLQAASQKNQGKNVVMDLDGNMFSLDGGVATPITVEEEVETRAPGGGGKATVTTKKKRQLRGAPKTAPNQMDQDTVLRAINDRVKVLQADDQFMASLRRRKVSDIPAEIQRVAKQQVLDEVNAIKDPAAARPGVGNRPPLSSFTRSE